MIARMRGRLAKTIAVLAVIGLICAYFVFDLGQYLSLDHLKAQQESLNAYYTNNPARLIAIYFGIYVLCTALSIPGATVITLAGGAVFGVFLGTVLVSIASTLGATLAFLLSRFLLRDWVQARFKDKLHRINDGIEKEGAFYLFTLRLVPAFPFFLVNLLMGLTRLPGLTFFWVSQLGMLPGTIAYVNAGTQLSKIQSFKDILSPSLLISFAVLGVLPLASKKLIEAFRK